MLYFTRLKTTLIVLFCAVGVLLTLPNLIKRPAQSIPWPQIHLGLDLRGGSYLLMQIDMNAVVKEQLANLTDEVRHTLLQADIGYTDLGGDVAGRRVQFNLVKPADAAKVRQLLAKLVSPVAAAGGAPDLDVKVTDAGAATLTLSRPALIAKQTQAIAQSITIIGRRIDGSGVVDPQIARQGADQIVIQLPGVSDPNQIKKLLGKTAHMTFHMVAEDVNPETKTPPPGVEILPMSDRSGRKLAIRSRVAVDGADLTNAQAGQDPQSGQWVVNFTFNSVGARKFADITTHNVGKLFAIELDHKIIEAPVIRTPIVGGRGRFRAASPPRARPTSRCCCARAPCPPRSRWSNSRASARNSERTRSAPVSFRWRWASCWSSPSWRVSTACSAGSRTSRWWSTCCC
ncbi:unnamed protein product [Acidocella sp. C78]|nr:unnamed protein product [Acidocella sp. C78]